MPSAQFLWTDLEDRYWERGVQTFNNQDAKDVLGYND